MRSFVVYLGGRVLLLAVLLGVGYLIGLRSYYLILFGLVASIPLSLWLLRRPRQALAADIDNRVKERQRLRSVLSDSDETSRDTDA